VTTVLAIFLAAVGLAIGSFLNVVIWRVPRGESVASPPSACPSCGHPIRPRDNVPVLGWLVLRGRCRDCAAPISARYPFVELLTAALFLAMGLRFGLDPALPAYLYLAAVGIALALIDLDVHRLPDVLTLPSYAVAGVLLGIAAIAGDDLHALLRAALGGAAMYAFYFLLVLIHPRGMGFGDVKLSGVLGLYTAFLGWDVWAAGLLLGFFLGGFFGIGLVVLKKGGRKTAVPFGPFMIIGACAAIFVGHELVDGYLTLTTGG
jgi:leader peptidase (prepilin peptidase)/N-methyltransferase